MSNNHHPPKGAHSHPGTHQHASGEHTNHKSAAGQGAHAHHAASEHKAHEHHKHEAHENKGHNHGGHNGHSHHDHHAMMVRDFRKRFWISLALTVPILLLSPMVQEVVELGTALRFKGDLFLSFLLSSLIFFYGGWPF